MKVNNFKYIFLIFLPFSLMLFIMMTCSNFYVKMLLYTLNYIFMIMTFLKYKRNNLLSIPILFTIYHVVYIGLCPVFFLLQSILLNNTTGLIAAIINDDKLFNQQCFLILVSYFSFLCASSMFNLTKKSAYDQNKLIQDYDKKIPYSRQLALLMVELSFIFEAIYITKNKFLLFRGSLETGRIEAMSANGVLLYGMWLGTFGLAMLYEITLRKRFNKRIFWALCLIHLFSIVLIGFRARVIVLVLFLLLIHNRYKTIEFKKLILFGIAMLLVVSFMSMTRSILSGVSVVSLWITIVTTLGNGSVNIYYVLRQFPDITNFQYGNTFLINFVMLAPGSQPDFTIWLKNLIGISFSGGGVTPTLLGEAWMNFGTIGVFVMFFIVGLICNHLDRKYYHTKNVYFILLNVWVVTSSVRGGFSNSLINLLIFSIMNFALYFIFTGNGYRRTI